MAQVSTETRPPDLFRRMARFPYKFNGVMRNTSRASLLYIQGEIPGYPTAPAGVDASRRTGTLGRTIGSSMAGGRSGRPVIFDIRQLGLGSFEGRMGTNLSYASRVIGERQGNPWAQYWWTLIGVAENALGGVVRLYNAAMDEMAAFLEGRG